MVTCSDTSFLFSVYGPPDCHTGTAGSWLRRHPSPVVITALNRFELINALRFSECRGHISAGRSATASADFETDVQAGRLFEKILNLADVLAEATRLSAAHTLTGGHRSLDILHIAAAKIMAATHFLTFDGNQKVLAENEGLIVPF